MTLARDSKYDTLVSSQPCYCLLWLLSKPLDASHIFVCNQHPKDLVITWVVLAFGLVLDTLLIYFWVALLESTSGLNLAADLGPILALFVIPISNQLAALKKVKQRKRYLGRERLLKTKQFIVISSFFVNYVPIENNIEMEIDKWEMIKKEREKRKR